MTTHDDMTIMTDFQEVAYAPTCGESFRIYIIIIISSWLARRASPRGVPGIRPHRIASLARSLVRTCSDTFRIDLNGDRGTSHDRVPISDRYGQSEPSNAKLSPSGANEKVLHKICPGNRGTVEEPTTLALSDVVGGSSGSTSGRTH